MEKLFVIVFLLVYDLHQKYTHGLTTKNVTDQFMSFEKKHI